MTVRRRTQVERRASAEAKLLAAASRVVASKGWVGMTLAEVGHVAGYSRGLATHHFGGKSELLRALATHINDSFQRDFRARGPHSEGLPGLLDFIDFYLGRSDPTWNNTRALFVLMAEAITDDSETGRVLSTYNRNVLSWLVEYFRDGIASGEMRSDVDPMSAAAIVLGAVRGVILQMFLKNEDLDLATIRRQVADVVRFGFSADTSKKGKAKAKNARTRSGGS
ncbi:MAG: TetR/AcrR family transcriptional regulator [Xanthobacteraceae bacterium]